MPGQPCPRLGLPSSLRCGKSLLRTEPVPSHHAALTIFQKKNPKTSKVLGKRSGAIAGSSVRGMEQLLPSTAPLRQGWSCPKCFSNGLGSDGL